MAERADRGGEAVGGVTGLVGPPAVPLRRPCKGGKLPSRDDISRALWSIEAVL